MERYDYYLRSDDYFKQALIRLPNVDIRYYYRGGDIKEILVTLQFSPDFIYVHDLEYFLLYCGSITGLNKVNVPKGISFHDLHRKANLLHSFVRENNINLIFAHYRDAFQTFFPEYKKKFRWLPHHVNTSVFYDYKIEKKIDYLLLGAKKQKFYPLRNEIYKKMGKMQGFVCHHHPGYVSFTPKEESEMFVEDKYAMEINRAKMFFTCDSILHYPIKKYFEVLASNTLLLASSSTELRDLGFIDGETIIKIKPKNFEEKAIYYLKNEVERKKIAQCGYNLVRARHTTEIRAKEYVDMIINYLKNGSM